MAESFSSLRLLWRELADGSAGWVVRLVVTLALGVLLTGACLVLSYMLAGMMPEWNLGSNPSRVYPAEELVAAVFVVGAAVYLAGIAWLWSRRLPHQAVWLPILLTMGLGLLTFAACLWVDQNLQGEQEFVVGGLVLLAVGIDIVIWLEAARRMARKRPLVNEMDGLPDVRCPACGYRMVGLRESRCPESISRHRHIDGLHRECPPDRRLQPVGQPRSSQLGRLRDCGDRNYSGLRRDLPA
jgi:hypothetical protein